MEDPLEKSALLGSHDGGNGTGAKISGDAKKWNTLQAHPTFFFTTGIAVTVGLFFLAFDWSKINLSSVWKVHSLSSDDSSMSWTMTRSGYKPLSYFDPDYQKDYLTYEFLGNYQGIIEPYVANSLHIFSDDESGSVSYYRYTICSTDDTDNCASGSLPASSSSSGVKEVSITFPCEAYTTFDVVISKYGSDYHQISETSGTLVCMYVRREIRELTAKDLSDTMDAMKVMWDVEEEEGQAVYGDSYHDIDYLIGFHFYNAAWQDADHIHEGLGFLPQHLKLTNVFELSMQAVNPATTLFFWDFTIDRAQNLSISESPMFTPDTFGSMPTPPDDTWGWLFKNSDVDDARIPDGRWKDAKTGVNAVYLDMIYAYGYMRAPWSMNPSTYITRFTSVDKTLPECEDHYKLASYTAIVNVLHYSPYSAHASTHGVIGGQYGCDVFDQMVEGGFLFNAEAQLKLCQNWLFFLKEFYRHGIVSPKTSCSVDSENPTYSECGFECNPAMDTYFRDLLGLNFLNRDGTVAPDKWDDATIDAWVEFICHGDAYKNFGGDHLEAASAADPSFWPIHPTLERLVQARYMAGGYGDYSWPTTTMGGAYACDKDKCFNADTNEITASDSCCEGHFADSQLMLTNSSGIISHVGLTNTEMMAAIDPTSANYSVPYIYSSFSWGHCASTGSDIDTLLADFADDSDDDSA